MVLNTNWLPLPSLDSGQVELANREIKTILMKVVNSNIKDWSLNCLIHCGPTEQLSKNSWNVPLSFGLWQGMPSSSGN